MIPPPVLQDIPSKASFWFSSYLCIPLINRADSAFQALLPSLQDALGLHADPQRDLLQAPLQLQCGGN